MKKAIVLISICLFSYNISITNVTTTNNWSDQINSDSILADIEQISSDEYEGRFAGSYGGLQAQNYIANKLNSSGITPLIPNTYFQNFTLPDWSQPISANVRIAGNKLDYINDFVEATLSGESNITKPTEIVFCGYGIDSPTYNDYANIDVNGKIALVSTDSPTFLSYTYAYTSYKITSAMNHGALGLMITNHPSLDLHFKKSTATIYGFEKKMSTIFVNRSIIEKYINFTSLMNNLDSFLNNNSNYNGENSVNIGITATMKIFINYKQNVQTSNILGEIKGKNDEYIILSAHHDHLGLSATKEVYNGADDDASGVAVILELARILSNYALQNELNQNIIFAFWSSEELGLVGSQYFVDNLPIPVNSIQSVLHLDMVGTGPTDGYLWVDGGKVLPPLFQNNIYLAANNSGISKVFLTEPEGGSDHFSFLNINKPAVMLFWDDLSSHIHYHSLMDNVQDINPEVVAKVTLFILNYIFDFNNQLTITSNTTNTSPAFDIKTIFLMMVIIIFLRKIIVNLDLYMRI